MKGFTLKLQSLKLALLLLLVAALLSCNFDGQVFASVYFGNSLRKVPIYCVDTEKKQVAISFDAAWGADKTEDIIKILQDYNADATFFLVGFWVEKYPEMVKEINEAGFEIGTHSNTHPNLTNLTASQMKLELETSKKLIEDITKKKVDLFRAPFGAYNNTLIDTALEMGLKTIQWDVDSLDWKDYSAMDITTRIINRVKCGSIILCHNNATNIVEALPIVLDRLQKKGYEITSVGDLIFTENYEVDNSGLQKST